MRGQAASRVVALGSVRGSGGTTASPREPGGIGANHLLWLSPLTGVLAPLWCSPFDRCPGPQPTESAAR